jgi:predicted HTH domain antitoxin
MGQLTIDIPEGINEHEVKMAAAAVLFDKGIFSSGQAAAIAGITKREFIENAQKYGASLFNENTEELKAPFHE